MPASGELNACNVGLKGAGPGASTSTISPSTATCLGSVAVDAITGPAAPPFRRPRLQQLIGNVSKDISATSVILSFFKQYGL